MDKFNRLNKMTKKADSMDEAVKKEEFLLEQLGVEELFEALVRALSVDELNSNYDYILRTYDLTEEYEAMYNDEEEDEE